jgi:hypothetical protein
LKINIQNCRLTESLSDGLGLLSWSTLMR